MKEKNKKVIGIDVGGTKIRGILWDKKQEKVLKVSEVPTPKTLLGFKAAINKVIKFLGKKNQVAVGAAGVVRERMLIKSPNIPYIKNFDFSSVSASFKIKRVDNDTRCFALAEYKPNMRQTTILFITLGTGVGRAIGRNGKVLRIKKFEYPERWERQYQKIRDSKDDEKLADFLAEKLTKLSKPYKSKMAIIGGGVINRKGFFNRLKKKISFPVRKPKFYQNSTAIGAAIL